MTHPNATVKAYFMQHEPSFISFMADFTEPQATPGLRQIVAKLVKIRNLLDFEMSKRDFTQPNLISLEKDLRDILKEIATSSDISGYLRSAEAALDPLRKTIENVNLAADAFDMPKTLTRQERLYKYYREIYRYICATIDCLQNKKRH